MPEEISDKTTARSFAQSLEGLSKVVSTDTYNSVLKTRAQVIVSEGLMIMAIKGIEANKVNSAGLLEISDNTTVNHLLEISKGLSKDVSKELPNAVSKYNDVFKENWITTIKDLREMTSSDSWTKWNMPTKLAEELRLRVQSEKGFLVLQYLRDSVSYVVDLSNVPKGGSFNTYGNEQMAEETLNDFIDTLLVDDQTKRDFKTYFCKTYPTVQSLIDAGSFLDSMLVETKMSPIACGAFRSKFIQKKRELGMDVEHSNLVDKASLKKRKIVKSTDIVRTYIDEGLWTENFKTLRFQSVTEIQDLILQHHFLLLHSPTFTGKSSLCQLLYQTLSEQSLNVHLFNLLEYNVGSETLEQYWRRKYHKSYEEFFNDPNVFILIDELQIAYPNSNETVQAAYGQTTLSTATIVSSHDHFYRCLKAFKGRGGKLIAFSSYGSAKIGSLLATPFAFDFKTTKYGAFSTDEFKDLISDFTSRTQIKFISDARECPSSFSELLWVLTDGHVGYVSAILHDVNQNFMRITDERSLLKYMHSNAFYHSLKGRRPMTDYADLPKDKQEALKELWRVEVADLNSCQFYEEFVRRGYVGLLDGDVVKLFCPLSKQLMLMNIITPIRPTQDTYEHLSDLMDKFLRSLPLQSFENTLSRGADSRVILESLWQEEFYRVATPLIAKNTLISVELGYKPDEAVKLGGRVDFFIDSDREWAAEFLITGHLSETTGGEYGTRALEHLARFEKNGKYSKLRPTEFLIVDFRPIQITQADMNYINVNAQCDYHNYWIVNYQLPNSKEKDEVESALFVTKIDSQGKCQSKNEKILFVPV